MASKSMGARYGHIKRKLSNGEYLNGELLALALEVLREEIDRREGDESLSVVRDKIKSGITLNEYEYHVFVEVILLHRKLES